jgi:hypothetical protein
MSPRLPRLIYLIPILSTGDFQDCSHAYYYTGAFIYMYSNRWILDTCIAWDALPWDLMNSNPSIIESMG